MINTKDFEQTKINFEKWWRGEDIGRPLMRVIGRNDYAEYDGLYKDTEEKHIGADYNHKRMMHEFSRSTFYGDAYPSIDLNMGPGSLACYLGSRPVFNQDTVWFEACIEDYGNFEINYDADNYWLLKHLEAIKALQDKSNGDYIINIPDVVENIDILAAMRDPYKLLYDLADRPQEVMEFINAIDATYFRVFDRLYDIVKDSDGGSSYTAFYVYGKGKTAKVQCDFSAMISPGHFREFVKPNLEKQCDMLDYSIYHLDGPEAICHVPALMEIGSLNALQWTPGYSNPDGTNEKWHGLYSQVKDAGKSMFVYVSDGDFDDWVRNSKKFVEKFGREGVYFLYPVMKNEQAERLIDLSYGW